MDVSEFDVTKVINNIKQHPFEIADYKLCKDEADVVMIALNSYRDNMHKIDIEHMPDSDNRAYCGIYG